METSDLSLRVLCLYCGGDLAQVRHTYPAERAAFTAVEHCRISPLATHPAVVWRTKEGAMW